MLIIFVDYYYNYRDHLNVTLMLSIMMVIESKYFGLQINNLSSLDTCDVPVWLHIVFLCWCAP
jgi:hypothetical protein